MQPTKTLAIVGLLVASTTALQDDLGISNGFLSFNTSNFDFQLVKSSQTLASLSPNISSSFDFSPFDALPQRAANGNYHLGDIVARYRYFGHKNWVNLDSAASRAPVEVLRNAPNSFSTSNLAPTIEKDSPLKITRVWGADGGDLTMSFTIVNGADGPVEIGGLGFPIEFNSIFTNRTAEDTQNKCSFTDPYIGLSGGYLRVTPLQGAGASLVVTPLQNTSFEGWRFLSEDMKTSLAYQSKTFEGFYSWEVLTKSYAENEWNATTPWNPPTSKILSPAESVTYGLRFSVAENIRGIEKVVNSTSTPLAVGIPGYIIQDDAAASLYLHYNSPVATIKSDPETAFTFKSFSPNSYTINTSNSAWGRVRVDINYTNGAKQTVHYFVTKSGPQVLSDIGNFLTTSQYYSDTSDVFGRAPSVASYDRSVENIVLQDERIWNAGLSGEGGAGSWLTAAMKQCGQPNAEEVAKLEDFVHKVVLGNLSPLNSSAVRKSLFYYQPNATRFSYSTGFNWTESWDKTEAYATNRAYDYVHLSAFYWSLYRVARFYPSLVSQATWDWYLLQSYKTAMFGLGNDSQGNPNAKYSQFGLMGETFWAELLDDLASENYTTESNDITATLKSRATLWASQTVPYTSGLSWDPKGQEGVCHWTAYFGFTEMANKTLNSILGFTPAVSHWGWNGNSRSYTGFLSAGKIQRIERQIHHYGSSLNALPILLYYQFNPTDLYTLRVGYAGVSGPLSNIDAEGFAAAAFHSFPETLTWDSYSGDSGPGFVGHILGVSSYVVDDSELGLIAFGSDVSISDTGIVTVIPKDTIRRKIYLAHCGVRIALNAGAIDMMTYSPNCTMRIHIAQSVSSVKDMPLAEGAVLRVDQMAQVGIEGSVNVTTPVLKKVGLGWGVYLKDGAIVVEVAFQ